MQPTKASVLCAGLGTLAGDPAVAAVVTDNRAAGPGSLFVCIKGERADGHDYAAAALAAGAVGILAQHPVEGVPAGQTILVADPLDAMIRMGANYRALFSPVVAGVTGSVGKTTTKEFCYAVFSAFGKTLKTEGNQNNEIGCPNTLLRLDDSIRYAVVEMGMQGRGEIEKLALAARPAGAVITGVGVAHLQQLGTRENILAAKMEICAGLPDGAPLAVNGDNDLLPGAPAPRGIRKVLFALDNPSAAVRGADLHAAPGPDGAPGTAFTILDGEAGRYRAFIPAVGRHNVMDALAAWTLATRLGIEPAGAAAALAGFATTGHRQHVAVHGGITVIEDCYNANPDSMAAGLSALAQYRVTGRRIAVLGDMFELGPAEEASHRAVGRLCAECGVDLVLAAGRASRVLVQEARAAGVPARHYDGLPALTTALAAEARPGDAVLVKASHGMGYSRLLSDFYAALDGDR